MRYLAWIFVALIVALQYPMWLGKGGWLRAWQIEDSLAKQQARNRQLEARNAGLAAEVADLKQGSEAIEERARRELGMVRNDEIFFQYENRGQSPISPAAAQSATSGSKKSH